MLSKAQLAAIAFEVRLLDTQMANAVASLTARTNWTGADRDAFEREWNDLVRSRLQLAAAKLDGVVFMPFA